MIRKMEVLGVALFAILAVSAVAASPSQAGEFTWDSGTTELTATQDAASPNQKFVTDPGTVNCNEVRGTATVTSTGNPDVTTKLKSITYNNSGSNDTCPGPFGLTMTINMNECGYTFTAGTTITSTETTGTAHIICPGTNQIVINGAGCTINVPAQSPAGHIVYKTVTENGKTHVTAEATMTGIGYSYSGFTCGSGTDTANGTYNGNITIKGYNGATHDFTHQTNISVS